jgi:hypothetical protein
MCSSWESAVLVVQPSVRSSKHQSELLVLCQEGFEATFEKDIPRMFGSHASLVVLHYDIARAHKALTTVQWIEANNCNFITAGDWPANSPDLSPMDYAINGIFKHRLWKEKTRNLSGLMRAMKEEWRNISKVLCLVTLRSRKGQVQNMLDNHGYQIKKLK